MRKESVIQQRLKVEERKERAQRQLEQKRNLTCKDAMEEAYDRRKQLYEVRETIYSHNRMQVQKQRTGASQEIPKIVKYEQQREQNCKAIRNNYMEKIEDNKAKVQINNERMKELQQLEKSLVDSIKQHTQVQQDLLNGNMMSSILTSQKYSNQSVQYKIPVLSKGTPLSNRPLLEKQRIPLSRSNQQTSYQKNSARQQITSKPERPFSTVVNSSHASPSRKTQ